LEYNGEEMTILKTTKRVRMRAIENRKKRNVCGEFLVWLRFKAQGDPPSHA
jgi:hypothetical protein